MPAHDLTGYVIIFDIFNGCLLCWFPAAILHKGKGFVNGYASASRKAFASCSGGYQWRNSRAV